MTRYENYDDDRDLADIIYDDFMPYIKDMYEEYKRNREERNDDEEYYDFY